ncbi:MAG TPA: TRAP transporter small permease subunit [Polyangiaceae bacterium]|nr:TRAP transporter small permease subunit [Polyangiaceae bacterium]
MADPGKAKSKSAGAAWSAPLERLDEGWQTLEARLCAGVLTAEVLSLTLWVVLRGLASDTVPGGNPAGLVCRNFLSAALLGGAAHLATRSRGTRPHRIAVTSAVLFGLFIGGRLWVHSGVSWASNVLNFLQNASVLMLIGGLRGLATRLTLWVALLGASLAASRGKHIHVDVAVRYLPVKMRLPSALAGWFATAAMCTAGVVGFVDYIGAAAFRVNSVQSCPGDPTKECDTPAGVKFATITHEMAGDLFLLGRQASLDLMTWPRVLVGTPYDKWMKAADWNAWLDGADWTAHFDQDAVKALHADASSPDATRIPQVVVPGTGEEARGLLIRELNFVFPFGLAAIAIKYLLRILLALGGRVELDPEAELQDEELAHHTAHVSEGGVS